MSSDRLLTPRFLSLWLFAFFAFFSAFQLLPAIPFRIMQLGGTKATAGSFLTVYTYASALAAPLMGSIADHIGRRRMLILASGLFIVFSLAYGVITWLPLLLVVGVVHGTLWSAILSSSSAIMADVIPAARRTQGLALWGLAGNTAVATAPAVGLWVFKFGWLTLCVELAVLSLVMALWATRIKTEEAHAPTEPLALRELWDWRVIRAALAFGVISFGHGGITTYVAIFSLERGIHPVSLYFTVFAVTIILVRLFTAHLGDRFGPKVVIYPAFAFIPISFAILSMATTRWQLVASAILYGIAFGVSYPAFANFIVTNTDPTRRARTFGSILLAFDAGIGTGSLVVGAIGEWRGLGTAFACAAALSCLAIPIFVAASKSLTHGTEVAPTAEHAGTG